MRVLKLIQFKRILIIIIIFMTTYWDDLQILVDISDLVGEEALSDNEEHTQLNDKDIADFKESMQYFIQDFIDVNIKLYKNVDF